MIILIKIYSINKIKVEEIILFYLKIKCNNLISANYIGIDKFFDNISKISQNVNTIGVDKKAIYEIMYKINKPYYIRRKMFLIKSEDRRLFKKIQFKFQQITSKQFDILPIYTKNILDDYIYVIFKHDDDKEYNCSKGQQELIEFLALFYDESNNTSIVILDEPCVHLSSKNKVAFRKQILLEESNKQFIIVTQIKN